MNLKSKVMENTCRTCLSYFNEGVAKNSLLKCSAITSEPNRFELMKNIMTACSLTLFPNEEEEISEIFVCTTCLIEIVNMLNFLEKCIHSDAILRQAVEVKEEVSCWEEEERENTLKPKLKIKVGVKQSFPEKVGSSFDSDDVPLSLYFDKKKHKQKDECLKCYKTFSPSIPLDVFKCKHVNCKFHTCVTGNETYQTLRNVNKHMKVKHTNLKYQSLNHQYSDVFNTKNNFCVEDKNQYNVVGHSCSVCERFFSKVSSFKVHENLDSKHKDQGKTSDSESKNFSFPTSTFTGEKKLALPEDFLDNKKDKSRKFQCPDCGKKFHHSYALKNHSNTHTGVKPFLCNVCGASFSALSNFTSHFKRIHSEEKQPPAKKYLCHSCGESFARAFHLKRHSLRKHIPNVEKKHECPVCKKKFLEKSDLAGHVKLHDDLKPFICDQCTKCFRTSWRLQAHIKRVHIGLRPFECPTCCLKFKTKSHLEKHIRTHTGEKPFPCPHCTYMCAEKSNLKKHIKIHLKTL